MEIALLTLAAVAQDTSAFKAPKEKLSYALGMEIGNGFRKQALDLDPTSVSRGFADAFSGGKTLLTEDEMRAVLTSAQEEYKAFWSDSESSRGFQSATSHFFAAPALAPVETPVLHVFSSTWQSPLAWLSC